MPFKSYRKESKSDYGRNMVDGENLSCEQLQTGAMLRIADATEVMAKNYTAMQADLEFYKTRSKEQLNTIRSMERTISSLKGVITKLKKKQGK